MLIANTASTPLATRPIGWKDFAVHLPGAPQSMIVKSLKRKKRAKREGIVGGKRRKRKREGGREGGRQVGGGGGGRGGEENFVLRG